MRISNIVKTALIALGVVIAYDNFGDTLPAPLGRKAS